MNYKSVQKLNPRSFKRRFGVRRKTFKKMVKTLKEWEEGNNKSQSGAKSRLRVEEKVLVTLEYWREYRTYFHIATSWGVSESTICRIVHSIESKLMKSGIFRLPGKKALLQGDLSKPEVVVMDVTETPIERPKRQQKKFYSGKKTSHTQKPIDY